jgi:hypothetical protein
LDVEEHANLERWAFNHSLSKRMEDLLPLVHCIPGNENGLFCLSKEIADNHARVPMFRTGYRRAGQNQVDVIAN